MEMMSGTDIEKAMALFVGWKVNPFPMRDPSRVESAFGPTRGWEFASQAASIPDELDSINPDWEPHDLVQASNYAASVVADRHQLGQLAHDPLLGCSFGYR